MAIVQQMEDVCDEWKNRAVAMGSDGAPVMLGKSILVQYSDKFMHTIVLYSIVLRRSQLYCIVNLLLCGYNTIQWCA